MKSNPHIGTCRKEMKRLRKNILPQMPSNLFHDVPGSVKIPHLNIGNLKRKMEDMKDDNMWKIHT